MDEWTSQLMDLSEEEVSFLQSFMTLPEDVQVLFRLWIQGDQEQSLEAEKTIYDMLEDLGHDVSELRASMNQRLESEQS